MKNLLSTLMLLSCLVAQSQISDASFDPLAESIRMARVPNSPEAQAFTKYGNTPVNMYTGTPNLQIPIYTHKGRELDLPISLTYDASGVKVEQLAGNVGLSWNLNVGGRISRIVNGLPDDFYSGSNTSIAYKSLWDTEVSSKIALYKDKTSGSVFDSRNDLLDFMVFEKKVHDNEYDTQPDYFSFSALGYSDMFTIDVASKTVTSLNNPRLKITITKAAGGAETPISQWVVTMDDGTKFTFAKEEVTKDVNTNDQSQTSLYGYKKEYNSSWLLTKIESANGKDTYDFDYTNLGFWSSNRTSSTLEGVPNALNCQGGGTSPTIITGYSGSVEYKIQQQVLSSITHNGDLIVDVNLLANRYDMEVNSAIEKINIYDKDTNTPSADLYKSFVFDYDYFKTISTLTPSLANQLFIRLKLDGVQIKDGNSTLLKEYTFEYNDPYTMPSTTSKGQDYYGYNNGATTNTVLYPTYSSSCIPSNGANRNPMFSQAKKGLLSKITYPTGGHTEFGYQANQEKDGGTYNEKAGVRIEWIKDYTDATTLATHKSYTYPSGTVISDPRLYYTYNQYSVNPSTNFIEITPILHRVSYASGTDKAHIGYSEVVEKVESASNPGSNGTISHLFNTDIAGNYKAGVYTYYIFEKEAAKQYGVTYQLGKSSGNTVKDENGVTVSDAVNSYYEAAYYSNTGIYMQLDDTKSHLYPIPTEAPPGSGDWVISYVEGTRGSTISNQVSVTAPSECNTNNFPSPYSLSELCTPAVGRLLKQNSYAWGKAGGLITSLSKQYYNGNILQQTKNNDYYLDTWITPPGKDPILEVGTHQLKWTTQNNSNGDVLKKEFFYADKITSGTLGANNMINIPVEVKTYKNSTLMSYKKTTYSGTLPDTIKFAKESLTLEDRVIFHNYDSESNIQEVSLENGTHTVYIWGYNKKSQLIAKIENFTASQLTAIQSLINTAVTASENDTDSATEASLRTALAAIRDHANLANAFMTSFTYNPVIGVTSITDPRGKSVYYYYDGHGRLQFVKDHNGKILSKNEYNYKN